MKKIIILCVAALSGHYIDAMEQEPQEKQITLRLKDDQMDVMPESELSFFTTIADAVHDAPDQEIPLPQISLETMALLRKHVPWALALHKKKKEAVTLEEISKMPAYERMAIAKDAAKEKSGNVHDTDTVSLKERVEAGNAAERLGAYELIHKYAQNITDMLKNESSALFTAMRKNKVDDTKLFDGIRGEFYYQIADLMESSEDWIVAAKQDFNKNKVRSVAVSADGTMAIAYLESNTAQIMKLDDQGNKWISKNTDHTSKNGELVAVSADGKTVVTLSHAEGLSAIKNSSKVRIMQWGENSWKESFAIEGEGCLAGVSADGKTVIAVVNDETKIIKWSDTKNKWIQTYNTYSAKNPLSACVSEDNSTVVIAFAKMTQILKWHDQEKQWIESLECDAKHWNSRAVVSADGNTVVMRCNDGRKIMQWRDQKWVESHKFEREHDADLPTMSANGNTVVTFPGHSTVKITMWNEETKKWISQQIESSISSGSSDIKTAATVSADGHTVVITWTVNNYAVCGRVRRMQWSAEDQKWIVINGINVEPSSRDGLSLNGVTKVEGDNKHCGSTEDSKLTIYESISMNTFDTWDKRILATFLAWSKKTGKPVTENAWVKQVLQTCDKREQRLLAKQYGSLLHVLTQSTTEKFE